MLLFTVHLYEYNMSGCSEKAQCYPTTEEAKIQPHLAFGVQEMTLTYFCYFLKRFFNIIQIEGNGRLSHETGDGPCLTVIYRSAE